MHKQGYIVDHLSLTRSIALDIPSGVATVRDRKLWCSQKIDLGGVESPLIFYTKKNKKKLNTTLHDQNVSLSLIK